MTKQESEFLEIEQGSDLQSVPELRRPAKSEAISAGLDYLLGQQRDGHWSATGFGSNSLITSCILTRMKDVFSIHSGHRMRAKFNESLDWVLEAHTPGGGWAGCSGQDDAGATAWAMLALGKSGRAVPESAFAWLGRCRRGDGGFASGPDSNMSSLETTALAVAALGHIDNDAESFLCARLQSDAASPAEQLAACAAILDIDKNLTPLTLLNQACQVTARMQAGDATDLALLLRCLLRLRSTRAWLLADGLRAMRRGDGSWPGGGDNGLIATATAVSTLALVDSQPGLYFGSDWPRPRRWRESYRG